VDETMTIRQIGDDLALDGTVPKEVMERLNVGDGDTLFIVEHEDGILLTPCDPKSEQVMEAYEDLGKRYSDTLRELAK
jgi:putative addiction module antidote